MRVLFVSPFPPARDGIGTYTQALMTALEAHGHETQVVVPRQQDGDALGHLGGQDLDEAVRSWSPDLIHVQFAVAAFGTRTRALLSWLRHVRATTPVPVIATMHEVTRDTAALRAPGRALYRSLAGLCDQVIVHTHSARTALASMSDTRITVIRHPEARPPRAVSSPAELRARFGLGDLEVLLAFGFVHVDKGLDDLVRALKIVHSDGSLDRVRLVIAGTVRPRHGLFRVFELRDRVHLARVLRMASRAGLADTIVQTGYVPEADIAGWFQAATAVVLPYKRTEQSGVASLANAFGTPVLASTAGGLGELYASSRWTYPPQSPGRLAEVLSTFLKAEDRTGGRMATADMESIVAATLKPYHTTAGRPVVTAGSRSDAP